MRCEPKSKIDFIKDIFELCGIKQTFIFVNSIERAEKIRSILKKADYGASILHSYMDKEERDKTMEGFRHQMINVLITTNLIGRGIDVPDCQLVINYDVPIKRNHADKGEESDNYMYML